MAERFVTSGAKPRIESLDYLRGLLAVAVMVYHYTSWAGTHPDAGTFLGRLGIYAVSMFYILSGLSLMLVYRDRLSTATGIRVYLIHRVFRIAPLFWLVVSASLLILVLPSFVNHAPWPDIDPWRVFLNYSLLFGFVQPSAYFSTGAWSIGNEVVFYALFPILTLAASSKPWVVVATFFGSLLIAAWFTSQIDPSKTLSASWVSYINPLNQLPFFIAGVLIGFVSVGLTSMGQKSGLALAILGLIMLITVDIQGDSVHLVTIGARLYFLLACALIVLGIYRANNLVVRIPWGGVLRNLGAWTYSIYLLHPFVPFVTTPLLGSGWIGYSVAGAGTLLVASLTYRFLEVPMMRIGKRLAARWRDVPQTVGAAS